ncbi:hypothetical protein J945_2998 [Acinetobacter baumannii 25878_2]|nr:hypothetical protein J945_2998 [Acinetobacter baumannii 25878_2]
MIDITSKILDLKLFEAEVIDIDEFKFIGKIVIKLLCDKVKVP